MAGPIKMTLAYQWNPGAQIVASKISPVLLFVWPFEELRPHLAPRGRGKQIREPISLTLAQTCSSLLFWIMKFTVMCSLTLQTRGQLMKQSLKCSDRHLKVLIKMSLDHCVELTQPLSQEHYWVNPTTSFLNHSNITRTSSVEEEVNSIVSLLAQKKGLQTLSA